VAVKFLSEEWAQGLKDALNANEAFRTAAGATAARIQQVITGDGAETHYWITIDDGVIDMGVGDLESTDATITQSYDTAVALATGKLNAVTAFMTGKIKIAGNMGLLLGLQGALAHLGTAMSSMDVEY
jgi:putative sterol carrier protein